MMRLKFSSYLGCLLLIDNACLIHYPPLKSVIFLDDWFQATVQHLRGWTQAYTLSRFLHTLLDRVEASTMQLPLYYNVKNDYGRLVGY